MDFCGREGRPASRNRHPFLQFFKPVQNDVDLKSFRSGGFGLLFFCWEDDQEPFAVGCDVVIPVTGDYLHPFGRQCPFVREARATIN